MPRKVRRALRGGNWNNTARNVRGAYRNDNNDPHDDNNDIGFRVAGVHIPGSGVLHFRRAAR